MLCGDVRVAGFIFSNTANVYFATNVHNPYTYTRVHIRTHTCTHPHIHKHTHTCTRTCSAMSSVYTFGPTFRAEKSHTRKHLAEFYMVEAEMTTPPGDLVSILEVIESLCKCVSRAVLVERGEDVEVFHKAADRPEAKVIMRVFMACSTHFCFMS